MRSAVGAPVAGQFLACGADDAAVYRITEVDDVELGNGVSEHNSAAERIRDGEREDRAEQGFNFEQRRDRLGREVK